MKIIVVGAGFGGMTAAALLAKEGHDVTVVEKNDQPGDVPLFIGTKGSYSIWVPHGI